MQLSPEISECRHTQLVEWDEIRLACGPEGNILNAYTTVHATIHDCINLQRVVAFNEGKSTAGDDFNLLQEFMLTKNAWLY